jgi:NhaC family Na+:H+ antiporter
VNRTPTPPGLALALLPLLSMGALLVAAAQFMPLTGELIVVVMLCAAAIAGAVAVRSGASFHDIQRVTGERFAGVLPAVLILLAIGMLISTWVMSGTIPYLVFWGVRLVDPQYLAVTAFLSTALMSSCTGTSWGSAGTIGVAMMGTAAAVGAPLPVIAGAVVSGAYFGDKMSPLSDSTIIAAVAADVDVYVHIRHMLYTAGPSFVIALVVYAWLGLSAVDAAGGLPDSARVVLSDLDRVFTLAWYTLLPPLVVVVCLMRRVPSVIAIVVSSLVAAVIAVSVQHFSLNDALQAMIGGFRTDMVSSTGVAPTSLSEPFVRLVQRGGLYSMSNTLVVILAAFLLAAAMDVSGALQVLIERLLGAVRSTFALIAATMTAGLTMIALTSHSGVTMLVIGGLFQQPFRDRQLAPQNLSRSLEDSVTITEVLMPWTVSAVFMATTLGVPTLSYAPWAVFCYLGPIFSLTIAALYARTGIGLARATGVPGVSAPT